MNESTRRLIASALVLGAIGCAAPTAPSSFAAGAPVAPASPALTAQTIATVLELTNAERSRAGLPPLKESTRLTQAAQLHSEQMGAIGRMDHVLPGTQYPSPPDRLAAVEYSWEAYGENVAMGQRTGSEVVLAWMQSSGHRANILNPRYTELGIGFTLDDQGRPFYAQVFGRPAR